MASNKIEKVTGIKQLKSTFKQREKIILRDFLAMERTTLANERTLFAYIRSGIYLAITGITFISLPELQPLKWLSFTMFILAGSMVVYGIIRYQVLKRKLRVYYAAMDQEEEADATKKDTSKESKKTQQSKK